MLEVAIEAPAPDGRYWHVCFYGEIVSLCPNETCAKLIARGLSRLIGDAKEKEMEAKR